MGGDIVYIVSKNASSPARTTSPTARPRPTRRTRSGCSPPSSGEHGIRVNGINPDGVVRGSGIFAKRLGRRAGRGLRRPEEELGEFYAQRTLLKREVLPEHVAAAVFALTGGDLSQTTGLHIPVDAGVAAAFLR
jgi:NAD(P)-dependent dehydrogenase (short-subunit alcohol dehydrogenase family)